MMRCWAAARLSLLDEADQRLRVLPSSEFLETRGRWLKSFSKQIARYSYGIYVSHVSILRLSFVRFRVGSTVVSTELAVFLTAVMSVLAYHCLADPAIRVGKRLASVLVQRRVFA